MGVATTWKMRCPASIVAGDQAQEWRWISVAIYTGLALFAGGGGLELGLSLALGTDYKTVAYVERECTSAAVLAANMERGWLDKAPIWDDVTTFTGDAVSPLVDNIDIISAGFPCQPWSVAGSRKGTEDERWLWPHIFRLVREIRPRSIFLENVPGLLHGGIEHVLGDLASIGFDAEWTSVRASDVGAPHRRERVFILGITSSSGRSTGRHREREHQVCDNGNGSPTEDIEQRGVGQSGTSEGSEALAHTVSERGRSGYGEREHATHAFPPGPSGDWSNVPERYWPAVKSDLRHRTDGVERGLARSDKLRILGNGVVPQQAALAYTLLSGRTSNL